MVAGSHGSVDPNATTKVALLLDICKVSASFRFDQLVFFPSTPQQLYIQCSMENNSDLTQRKVSISGVEIPFQSKTASGFFHGDLEFGIGKKSTVGFLFSLYSSLKQVF